MTTHKNDNSNSDMGKQSPMARGGVPAEDRAKGVGTGQSGPPSRETKTKNSTAGKKASEQKRR